MHAEFDPRNKNEHHDLVTALVDAGSAWAKYGLDVGRLALETSARTLGATASALGEIAKTFESREREAGERHDDKPVVDTK